MKSEAASWGGDLLEYRAPNRWLVLLILAIMVLLLGRFFQLQVVGGRKYEKLAEINQVRRSYIPPRRGLVLDRHGRVLADNIDLYDVVIIPHYVEDLDSTLARLQELLFLTDQQVSTVKEKYYGAIGDKRLRFREIPVVRHLNGRRCPVDGTRLEEIKPEHSLWCSHCGKLFSELPRGEASCPLDHAQLTLSFDQRQAECPECHTRFVFGKRCPEDDAPLQGRLTDLRCPRCLGRYSDLAALLQARLHELPGVQVRDRIVRAYPFGELFAHVVGYINEVNAEDIARHPELYRPGDYAGRRGVERSMEDVLRGKAGEEVMFRDSKGRRLVIPGSEPTLANLKYEAAVAGNNVVLTLDVEIQKILTEALASFHSAGIAVVDVRNGEVLGLHSTPAFDPNEWSGRLTAARKKEYDDNPFHPLLNKATTAFPPASTFKVVTALAALGEGIVTLDTRVNCPGYYNYSGRRFGCYNKYGHGDLDLRKALAVSCDVYFYRLGEWLGMDRLEHYATLFGLGHKSGVEIGEDTGLVPSREWHATHSKGGFQPGFTLSTAVGQKDIKASPLQMATVLAQVVNGGCVVHPFLVDHIEDEHGGVVRSLRKSKGERLPIPEEHLQFVRDSMVEAVETDSGTGKGARLESIRMGAKTGTAEARQARKGADPYVARWLAEDHAWFVAFAPAEEPIVAVALIVEHGGFGGEVAGPPVSKVIYRLFSRELVGP